MKLKDKVVLVTGGGRGIGRAIALACARQGARVAICARTQEEIDRTVSEIRGLPAACEGWPCDVSVEEQAQELVRSAQDRFGRIDALFNNAGVMTRASKAWELEVKKWDYTIAVNLRGIFLVTRAVVPIMIRQKSGSIINLASAIGRMAYPNFIAYSTSKWGLEGFTQALAAELRPYQVRVNSVDPGTVATKLTGFAGSKPESVTEVFVYLASDDSSGVTGKMLTASGYKSEVR